MKTIQKKRSKIAQTIRKELTFAFYSFDEDSAIREALIELDKKGINVAAYPFFQEIWHEVLHEFLGE